MQELSLNELSEVAGGDNPGMGTYDGRGDRSAAPPAWYSEAGSSNTGGFAMMPGGWGNGAKIVFKTLFF